MFKLELPLLVAVMITYLIVVAECVTLLSTNFAAA